MGNFHYGQNIKRIATIVVVLPSLTDKYQFVTLSPDLWGKFILLNVFFN